MSSIERRTSSRKGMGWEGGASLDVRDVKHEHGCRQNGDNPDESRISGLIHDNSCTYKSCARTLTASLISIERFENRSIPVEVFQTDFSKVLISISDFNVRCTGHLSAISINRLRCSASSVPSSVMIRSIRSTMPSLVSQFAQSPA